MSIPFFVLSFCFIHTGEAVIEDEQEQEVSQGRAQAPCRFSLLHVPKRSRMCLPLASEAPKSSEFVVSKRGRSLGARALRASRLTVSTGPRFKENGLWVQWLAGSDVANARSFPAAGRPVARKVAESERSIGFKGPRPSPMCS